MQARYLYKILFVATLITFVVIVAAIVLSRHGPSYHGRSVAEWFDSGDSKERLDAFRAIGTNSFPFLVQKLGASYPDRIRACTLIDRVFNGTKIDDSAIKMKLETMLASKQQQEQMVAYEAIRHLNIAVSDDLIAEAARTSSSIKGFEMEANRKTKAETRSIMTNFTDYSSIAKLCNDTNPLIQREAISSLSRGNAKLDKNLYSEKIAPALALVITNPLSDPSVLRMAIAYVSGAPQRMEENLPAICSLLTMTTNSTIQLNCLSFLTSLGRYDHPLPATAQQSIESLKSRANLDLNVRNKANDLLNNPYFATQSNSN